MYKIKFLTLFIMFLCSTIWLNATTNLTTKDGRMTIIIKGFTIKSLLIDGKERLKSESTIKVVDSNQTKLLIPTDIKVKDSSPDNYEVIGVTSLGTVKLSAKVKSDNIKITISGEFTKAGISCRLPINIVYDKINYIRFDSSVVGWDPEIFKNNGRKYLNQSLTFNTKSTSEKFDNVIMRQFPVAVMSLPDKRYFSFERTTGNLKNGYTIMSISGSGGNINSFVADFRNSAPEKHVNASVVLRAGKYIHDAFVQSCLDARNIPAYKKIPSNAIFAREERGIYRGLKKTDKVVIAEWAEGVMSFDGVPIKHSSYEKIRRNIIAAKKKFPNLKAVIYWSPTLYRNDPLYNYSETQQHIFKNAFIRDKQMRDMFILYHGLEKTPNYFMDMSPDQPYGKMLLNNVRTLLKKIPEADGLFLDNFFYGVTFYAEDYDYGSKTSSIKGLVDFIKALRNLPEMKTKLICVNGALEPETASLMDCFLSEPSKRGTMLYYSMRFGKPIFHLRKLGYLSLSDAQFWNLLPNGSDVLEHSHFPACYDSSLWPEAVKSKAKMLSPYVMYYPDLERYVVLARCYYLAQSDLLGNMICKSGRKSLKELTFQPVKKNNGQYYVEYLYSPDLEVSAYQKYSQVRRFFANPEKVTLQPHTAAVIEPLKLQVNYYWSKNNGKTGLFIIPSHNNKVLNGLTVKVSCQDSKERSVEKVMKYIDVDEYKGYYVQIPGALIIDKVKFILDSNGEKIEYKVKKTGIENSSKIASIANQLQIIEAKKMNKGYDLDKVAALLKLEKQQRKAPKGLKQKWLTKKNWRPGSPRMTINSENDLLICTLHNDHNFRWANCINKDFTRHPGADWSLYKGIGFWLYPVSKDYTKLKLNILRSYGAVRNRERVSRMLKLKPNRWNYYYIDFGKYKFDYKDVWRFQLAVDGHWFQDNKDAVIILGGFELFTKN